MGTSDIEQIKPALSRSNTSCSKSFRLRCPSLNSIRLRRIFDLFDKNNDGVITVTELSQALQLLGLESELSDLEIMIKPHVKPDQPGLDFEDFEALHKSLNDVFFGLDGEFGNSEEKEGEGGADESQVESDLTEAFKVFDEDGDGYISARELQVVLGKLGLAEGSEIDRVEKMISSVDRNHDGRVDYFEFKDMMRSVIVRNGA